MKAHLTLSGAGDEARQGNARLARYDSHRIHEIVVEGNRYLTSRHTNTLLQYGPPGCRRMKHSERPSCRLATQVSRPIWPQWIVSVEEHPRVCCAVALGGPRLLLAEGVHQVAEDSDHRPTERSTALPRRVPGTGGLTQAQVRRGFLPPRAPESGTNQTPPQTPPRPQDRDRPAAPRPGGSLPQRRPGTSAIQAPPQTSPRPRMTEPGAQEALPPSPATFAASAAKLLGTARPAPRPSGRQDHWWPVGSGRAKTASSQT